MQAHENIQKTFNLMVEDLKSKGYKVCVAYYIRPEGTDIDKITEKTFVGFASCVSISVGLCEFQKIFRR